MCDDLIGWIMKWFISLAMILLLILLATGCVTPPEQTPVATPPETTVAPTTQPTANPEPLFSTLIAQGNAEIAASKASVISGKASLAVAMKTQGVSGPVITSLYQSRSNFTAAESHLKNAQDIYSRAAAAAPSNIAKTVNDMNAGIPSNIRAVDGYLVAVQDALNDDWYSANADLNSANIEYQQTMQNTNTFLLMLGGG
jgi:hypothetical protein